MKKRKFILAGLVVVVAVVAACFTLSTDHVQVVGELSPSDLADVKKAIHREIWRGTLPDYSWSSIKNLPSNILLRQKQRILGIYVRNNDVVFATISISKAQQTDPLCPPFEQFPVVRFQKVWKAPQIDRN